MIPPHGRPKEGSLPLGGKARSAKGAHTRPPHGRPQEGSLPLGGKARSAKGAHTRCAHYRNVPRCSGLLACQGTPTHRALASFAPWLAESMVVGTPDHALLNRWATERALALPDGRALRFVPPARSVPSAIAYERQIVEEAEIVTRLGSLHDLCNAIAWLLYPLTKARVSAIHVANAAEDPQPGRGRGALRDAATLLDESGVIVTCADPHLVALWRAHEWRQLFHDRRKGIAQHMRIGVIGHGLAVKLLAPFPSLTAKALVLETDAVPTALADSEWTEPLDRAAATWLDRHGRTWYPRTLLPLPITAWPEWDAQDRGVERFDDTAVFRPCPCR